MYSKEEIYDAQISPLMAQIIDICNEHKIAMIADFDLGRPDDSSDNLKCTTFLLNDSHQPSERMLRAAVLLQPR